MILLVEEEGWKQAMQKVTLSATRFFHKSKFTPLFTVTKLLKAICTVVLYYRAAGFFSSVTDSLMCGSFTFIM